MSCDAVSNVDEKAATRCCEVSDDLKSRRSKYTSTQHASGDSTACYAACLQESTRIVKPNRARRRDVAGNGDSSLKQKSTHSTLGR